MRNNSPASSSPSSLEPSVKKLKQLHPNRNPEKRKRAGSEKRDGNRRAEFNANRSTADRSRVYDMEANRVDMTVVAIMCTGDEDQFNRMNMKGYKMDLKKQAFLKLMHLGRCAESEGRILRYSRSRCRGSLSKLELQVVDAACEAELFADYRSPPGSPKQSRLVPLFEVAEGARGIAPLSPTGGRPGRPPLDEPQQFVFLRDRETKDDIPFDVDDPIPKAVQEKLEVINGVNNQFEISYRDFDPWEDCHVRRRLHPVPPVSFREACMTHFG